MRTFNLFTIVLMVLWVGSVFGENSENIRFVILNSEGKEVSLSDVAKYCQTADVIFFGEKHDNAIAHKLEQKFLAIFSKNSKKLAIAMEMFEADNQDGLDKYLAGKIDEKQFEKEVRLWDNYKTDYRPIIEFAKSRKIPVLASNIPRRYASMVAKGGIAAWDSVSESERKYLPRKYHFLKDDYRKNFFATMTGNPMMKYMGEDKLENIYDAQCVKDEKMAESIADFLKSYEGYKIISFNGSFHSDYKLGIPQKLSMRMPKLKIANISTVVIPNDIELKAENLKGELSRADFVIFVGENTK